MITLNETVEKLITNQNSIFSNRAILDKIAYGVQGYIRIQNDYENNQMTEEFKKYFAYFYRMGMYAKADYKARFFEILKDLRDGARYTFNQISTDLYNISNKHQFSFITKLIHTTNTSSPIYDSLVAKVLDLPNVGMVQGLDEKISLSNIIISDLTNLYSQVLADSRFQPVLETFDLIFNNPPISNVKKLDFIIWAYGSII